MSKVYILVLIAILQLVSSSLFSCEINTVGQSTASIFSMSDRTEKSGSVSIEKAEKSKKNNMAESHQDRCSKCTSCNEVLISSMSDEITFSATVYSALNFSYVLSYNPPFINFDPKPPCFNLI